MSRSFKTVCVSGFFDPLHTGHIDYFKNSKLLGDKLIVILNKDCQRNCKMVFNENERKIMIESIRYVDEVVLSIDEDQSVAKTLNTINPTIFAKGSDVISETEKNICESQNIEIIYNVGQNIYFYDLLYSLNR